MKTQVLIISILFFTTILAYPQTHTFCDNTFIAINECVKFKPEKTSSCVTISDIGYSKYTVKFKNIKYTVRFNYTEVALGKTGYHYDVIYSSNTIPMEKEIVTLTKLSDMSRGVGDVILIFIDDCNSMTIDCR